MLLIAACLSGAGCGSAAGPTTLMDRPLQCTLDLASPQAKDTIERIGGLVTDDYVVRFSQSTRAGVVALVSGDTGAAFTRLSRDDGVAIVARIDDDGSAKVVGFDQVRALVDAACGPATSP